MMVGEDNLCESDDCGIELKSRFNKRYIIATPALDHVLQRPMLNYGTSRMHTAFRDLLKDVCAIEKVHGVKGSHIYHGWPGLAHVMEYKNGSVVVEAYADQHRSHAEFGAGQLGLIALKTFEKWVQPSRLGVASADGKVLNDLVEVRVDGWLGAKNRSMLLGVLPLHYSNGKTVQRSVEAIRGLEQEIMDDLILSHEEKLPSEFSFSTSVAYIWERKQGFLQGFQQKLQGTPDYLLPRVLREGKLPVRVT